MPARLGRGSVLSGSDRASARAGTGRGIAIALSVPLVLSCAGAPLPVFLPGEPVECLFEVMGSVTVEGPFGSRDEVEAGIREVILEGVRIEVGRQTVDSGADAVMVREFVYQSDPEVAASDFPEIVAAEGMLLRFVDPACLPPQ